MQIKRQIYLLLTTMIVFPFVCFLLVPFYFYMTSSKAYLMKDYAEARIDNELMLSSKSWDKIEEYIKSIPLDVEVLVVYNKKVLISTFSEYQKNDSCTPKDFFDLMQRTNSFYDYQFHTFNIVNDEIKLEKKTLLRIPGSKTTPNNPGFVIKRYNISSSKNSRFGRMKFLIPFYIIILFMEGIAIAFALFITRIVSKSVIRLKLATENIVRGDMETPIDTTMNKREADEISSLAENLETMRLSLKESKERRTRFIMGISHDLRTPVALIKGYSEAIEDGIVKGDQIKNSACLINQNAERLEEMINELINYVKLNNSDWKQKLEVIELKPILEGLLCNMKYGAEIYKKTVDGSISIPDGTKVHMDTNLFQRAIENLFANSMRYTKDGDTISFSAWLNEKGEPVISMKDTGPGIAKKDQKKIFELFFRGTNSRRENGMGIGLAVVKTIIETHGWKIDVKSELKKGTEFLITIPKENS